MTSLNENTGIDLIYKSRKGIIEMLKDRSYNVDNETANVDIDQFVAMYDNENINFTVDDKIHIYFYNENIVLAF